MIDFAAEFELQKAEVQRKLAELQRDFPNATQQCEACSKLVDEFFSQEPPQTDDERQQRVRQQLNILQAISANWSMLNRMRLWSNH